jgi:hypothetical protein
MTAPVRVTGMDTTKSGRVRSWRCMVNWHKWVRRHTDDGVQYAVCQRCGREHDVNRMPYRGGGLV